MHRGRTFADESVAGAERRNELGTDVWTRRDSKTPPVVSTVHHDDNACKSPSDKTAPCIQDPSQFIWRVSKSAPCSIQDPRTNTVQYHRSIVTNCLPPYMFDLECESFCQTARTGREWVRTSLAKCVIASHTSQESAATVMNRGSVTISA